MMTRYFYLATLLLLSFSTKGQELTGEQLLENAISFHDPQDNWNTFKGKLLIEMESPKATLRSTLIELDLPATYFKSTVKRDDYTIESELQKEHCVLKYNGKTNIAQQVRDSLRITCDRAKLMKDYYTYLYGLPMKLKDPGTLIDPKVVKRTFKGKDYLVLKVMYEKEVGQDTWYFYFDPNTYAMEIYQFYHDESKNDGEYILLTDLLTMNDIKFPKTRAWYYNKDNTYLATDKLRIPQ
ncbi:hypothetical protein SAMN04488009_0456 [Maribacter sedimenticola]|uniref:Aspartyl-tRNA synthetase n=1 Tax=Maribacter sedimenticola TaxID=228956 RepID=A0ABY1SDA0_9FLAO|nr:DUF6503 family protein [Maribacter sedimenticola]SNR26086.1 hypothetical protein SAMN04488009_0456 [Maribacter sedimenticola]